jgi:hypothetical protein
MTGLTGNKSSVKERKPCNGHSIFREDLKESKYASFFVKRASDGKEPEKKCYEHYAVLTRISQLIILYHKQADHFL